MFVAPDTRYSHIMTFYLAFYKSSNALRIGVQGLCCACNTSFAEILLAANGEEN